MEIEKFVVGDKTPSWFDESLKMGKAKVNYYNDELVNIVIIANSKEIVANIGDVIIKTNSGLSLIPRDKAIKYKLI